MSKKKINFKPKIPSNPIDKKLDAWVLGNSIEEKIDPSPTENLILLDQKKEYRFTVVIPTYLHRRIKKYCAVQGISIKEKLTAILEKEFPEIENMF